MKTLLVGYKAADLTPELLEGDVTCHVLDIYHRHAIEKVHHAKVVCSAHLPEGPWDVVKFKTGPKIHSGELALDLLQECYRVAGCGLRVVRFQGPESAGSRLTSSGANGTATISSTRSRTIRSACARSRRNGRRACRAAKS